MPHSASNTSNGTGHRTILSLSAMSFTNGPERARILRGSVAVAVHSAVRCLVDRFSRDEFPARNPSPAGSHAGFSGSPSRSSENKRRSIADFLSGLPSFVPAGDEGDVICRLTLFHHGIVSHDRGGKKGQK